MFPNVPTQGGTKKGQRVPPWGPLTFQEQNTLLIDLNIIKSTQIHINTS